MLLCSEFAPEDGAPCAFGLWRRPMVSGFLLEMACLQVPVSACFRRMKSTQDCGFNQTSFAAPRTKKNCFREQEGATTCLAAPQNILNSPSPKQLQALVAAEASSRNSRAQSLDKPETLNPQALNPDALNPKPLNPKPPKP